MQKRSNRVKPFSLSIGNDPSLWRYAALEDAIADNADNIVQLIKAGLPADTQPDNEGLPNISTETGAA